MLHGTVKYRQSRRVF